MQLVIAEKPSVARSIANVLGASNKKKGCLEGNGYIVSWCVGHLIALAEPEAYDVKYTVKPWQLDTLPILPQKWKFKVIEETKEQYGILKSLMQNETVYEIICATDAGREGECIFRYVYKLAGCNKPVKRLWISSVEESDIRQGFDNLKDDREYDNLYSSGFARAKADWLVGMNATRLFSAASGAFLSVGRVQTPTLAMIVNRENEINSFQKQKYYTVELNCGAFSVCSEKITELSSAQRIQKNTDENTAFIKSIVTENKKVKPPELFDLTALQKTANISLGYTAQQTLNYAQSLYEKSIITYPRTDSRYVNASMKDKLFKLTEGAADINVGRYRAVRFLQLPSVHFRIQSERIPVPPFQLHYTELCLIPIPVPAAFQEIRRRMRLCYFSSVLYIIIAVAAPTTAIGIIVDSMFFLLSVFLLFTVSVLDCTAPDISVSASVCRIFSSAD